MEIILFHCMEEINGSLFFQLFLSKLHGINSDGHSQTKWENSKITTCEAGPNIPPKIQRALVKH